MEQKKNEIYSDTAQNVIENTKERSIVHYEQLINGSEPYILALR